MTTTTKNMAPLTNDETEAAETIIKLAADEQLGLMRVDHNGVQRAALITVQPGDTEDEVHVHPVALLLDQELFDDLVPAGFDGDGGFDVTPDVRKEIGDLANLHELNDPFGGYRAAV